MAYGNWGAIVTKKGKLRMDLCDYYDEVADIGGHAVVFIGDYALEFHKDSFPVVSVKTSNGYKELSERELFDLIDDDYKWCVDAVISGSDVTSIINGTETFAGKHFLNFNSCEYIIFNGFRIEKVTFRDITFWKVKNNRRETEWFIIIGCSIGNGFRSVLNQLLKKIAKKEFMFDYIPHQIGIILGQRIDSGLFEIKMKLWRLQRKIIHFINKINILGGRKK